MNEPRAYYDSQETHRTINLLSKLTQLDDIINDLPYAQALNKDIFLEKRKEYRIAEGSAYDGFGEDLLRGSGTLKRRPVLERVTSVAYDRGDRL